MFWSSLLLVAAIAQTSEPILDEEQEVFTGPVQEEVEPCPPKPCTAEPQVKDPQDVLGRAVLLEVRQDNTLELLHAIEAQVKGEQAADPEVLDEDTGLIDPILEEDES